MKKNRSHICRVPSNGTPDRMPGKCGYKRHLKRSRIRNERRFYTAYRHKKENGSDNTAVTSEITSSTFVVIKSVAGDKNAIGYVSLGTLAGDVKALKINRTAPSAENIENRTYPLVRTFNIVDKGDLTAEAQDFVDFVMSAEGRDN